MNIEGQSRFFLGESPVLVRILLAFALFITCVTQVNAELIKTGIQESTEFVEAEAVSAPQPIIPSELYEEGMKCSCVARFTILDSGKTRVKIVSSSGNHEVDCIALRTLQRWIFKPAMLNGKPVESNRKVKIHFEIE